MCMIAAILANAHHVVYEFNMYMQLLNKMHFSSKYVAEQFGNITMPKFPSVCVCIAVNNLKFERRIISHLSQVSIN